MTYEENVRETAHQMVLSMYNTIVALPSTISMFERAARRVVDAKAEGFTDAWNLTNSYLPGSEKDLNRLLIERGLIPAPVDTVINSYAAKAAKRAIPENRKSIEQIIRDGSIPDPECQHSNMKHIIGREWACLECKKTFIRKDNKLY